MTPSKKGLVTIETSDEIGENMNTEVDGNRSNRSEDEKET